MNWRLTILIGTTATAALLLAAWLGSAFYGGSFGWQRTVRPTPLVEDQTHWQFFISRGQFVASREAWHKELIEPQATGSTTLWQRSAGPVPVPSVLNAAETLGFEFFRSGYEWEATLPHRDAGSYGDWQARVPIWLPIAMLMWPLTAATLLPAARRRKRLEAGLCAGCGFDMRGTLDRCPECGTAPPRPHGEPKVR